MGRSSRCNLDTESTTGVWKCLDWDISFYLSPMGLQMSPGINCWLPGKIWRALATSCTVGNQPERDAGPWVTILLCNSYMSFERSWHRDRPNTHITLKPFKPLFLNLHVRHWTFWHCNMVASQLWTQARVWGACPWSWQMMSHCFAWRQGLRKSWTVHDTWLMLTSDQ